MKEYKVVGAKDMKHAEQQMNEMAQQGWEVVDVSFYYGLKFTVMITFSRDKKSA